MRVVSVLARRRGKQKRAQTEIGGTGGAAGGSSKGRKSRLDREAMRVKRNQKKAKQMAKSGHRRTTTNKGKAPNPDDEDAFSEDDGEFDDDFDLGAIRE